MTPPPTGSSSGESAKAPSPTAAFVTFYSFKGGVGRSMALINTACILAGTRGFRVLVIDLDLEAPGLSYLNTESPDTPSSSERPPTSPHLGFVDLITDAKARGEDADLFCLQPDALADKYTRQVRIPESESEFKDGSLHIMPAGLLDDGYTRRLDELDLNGLYRDGIGEPLIRAFKQRIGRCGLYDYVLVDSRTGISEGAGICTRDLAEHVMVLSGLNRQNVEGTSKFLAEFKAMNKDSKTVQVILSPVPNGEDDLLERRRSEAAQKFKAALGKPIDLSLEIPYHPQLALTEEPHIFRSKRGYLFEAYRRIEASMLQALGHTPEATARRIIKLLEALEFTAALEGLQRLVRLPGGRLCIPPLLGRLLPTQERERVGASLSPPVFQKLLISPSGPRFFSSVIKHISQFSDTIRIGHLLRELRGPLPILARELALRIYSTTNLDARSLVQYAKVLERLEEPEIAEQFYKRAITVDSTDSYAVAGYTQFLHQNGRPTEAEILLRRLIESSPTNPEAHFAFGVFLTRQGRRTEAKSAYEQGLRLQPEQPFILANLIQLLLADGERDQATRYLQMLHAADVPHLLQLEVAFYEVAHFPNLASSSLRHIRKLLNLGLRSAGWSLSITIDRAMRDGHPNPSLLRSLAAVICDGADPASLDVYPEWQAAKAGPPN